MQLDMDLGVSTWRTALPTEPTRQPALAAGPRDPDAPAWWDGENTNEFLAEQGVVLG